MTPKINGSENQRLKIDLEITTTLEGYKLGHDCMTFVST